MAVALSVGRVLIANRLVEASQTLRSLDTQIAQVQKENQDLSQALRAPGSIDAVEVKARQLGFVKTTNYVFLSKPPSTAMQSTVVPSW